jgi:two-component system sensor histidine kinase QseC
MMRSLQGRLLVTLLAATLAVWAATALTSYLETRNEVSNLLDAQLAQSAEVLMALVSHEVREHVGYLGSGHAEDYFIAELKRHLSGYRYEHEIAFQVWTGEKQAALRSAGAPAVALSNVRQGFSNTNIENAQWRVVTISDDTGLLRIHVAEHLDVRKALTRGIVIRQLIPLLVGFPLLALLIWFGVGRSLTPLNRLAGDVAKRNSLHLHPVGDKGVPTEVRPLVDAINSVFLRLKQALEREKRFTADAAHELRTPLAGLRTQAEVAKRSTDDTERRKALDQLLQGVDQNAHLVSQLLTLARVDPEASLDIYSELDLCEIAASVIADLAGDAMSNSIDLGLDDGCCGKILGNVDGVRILIRNLVDNAIKYTPRGGRVTVAVTTRGRQAILKVNDSGPGIPAGQREKVLERFYRSNEGSVRGSGLGLSIVHRIAQLHNASIALAPSELGGLAVDVTFPEFPGSIRVEAGNKLTGRQPSPMVG